MSIFRKVSGWFWPRHVFSRMNEDVKQCDSLSSKCLYYVKDLNKGLRYIATELPLIIPTVASFRYNKKILLWTIVVVSNVSGKIVSI